MSARERGRSSTSISRGRARESPEDRGGRPEQQARLEGPQRKGRGDGELDAGGALRRAARRLGMESEALLGLLASQAWQPSSTYDQCPTSTPSRSDIERLLIASERLGLDPLNGEVYLARPTHTPSAPPQVVLGLDGWIRLLNVHPQVCGVEFTEGPPSPDESGLPGWASCTIHRRDRSVPTTVREYMDEARGATGAWLTHPRRMLRHCALVQCARVAIGPAGAHNLMAADETLGEIQHKLRMHSKLSRQADGQRIPPADPQGLKSLLTEKGQLT